MTAAWMRPSRAAHTVPPSLLLRSRREHNRDRLRIERLAALVEVALLGQRCRDPPQAQRPPPFGFLRASRFASATTSGRVSTWLLRPRPSRQSPCACASAPLQAWPQGSSYRTQRPRPTPDAPARRSVCPRQSGWATGGATMPPTALPSRSLESGRGRQGLSARRSGVGQFGSRRARLSPRAPGGVFGSGGSGVSFGSASNFASAARSGSRRGARRNRSSSMARRIAAVTAAYSSSVRSIVGMA